MGKWAQVGLEDLLVGVDFTVQSQGVENLPVSEASEP